jgi:mono/diheme cytochrome c family protein
MCREHDLVREREWHPARPSLSRFRHSLSLGVIVPALALMLAACKKGQTSTPSNEAPADSDTVSTSQAPPPEQVAQAPAESEAATSGEMRAETTSSGEQAKAPEPGTAESAPSQRAAVKSEGAAPARSEPAQAPAQAAPEAPPPAPETKAAADTPTTGGQGQAGGEQQAGPQQASLNATPQEYQGWKNFSANCERCHGQDALGSAIAPDLRRSINQGSVLGTGKLNHDLFIGTVTAGRPAKGMPSWAQLLDRDQMESIWAYLTARAGGKLSAGRPIPQGT